MNYFKFNLAFTLLSFIYVAGLWNSDVTFRSLCTTVVVSFPCFGYKLEGWCCLE